MIRGAKAVIYSAGILLALGAVSTAERTVNRHDPDRHDPGSRRVVSIDQTKIDQVKKARQAQARQPCVGRCKSPQSAANARKSHASAETRVSRAKAKARIAARLRVFDAGRPGRKTTSAIYRLGAPYMMAGRLYTPRIEPNYRAEGKASWYGKEFHGRRTANGEKFDMHGLTAAHPTLPLPSYVRVTNLENNRSLVVRLNDRGPYHGRRLIDVSVRVAKLLGFYDQGLARVRVEYVGRAGLGGSDDKTLAATLRNGASHASAVRVAAREPARSARK